MEPERTLEQVKNDIARLPRGDRAALRPWLLARYDVRGYLERSVAAREPPEPPDSAKAGGADAGAAPRA